MKKGMAIMIILICLCAPFSAYANSGWLSVELKNGEMLFDSFTINVWYVTALSDIPENPSAFIDSYIIQTETIMPEYTAITTTEGTARFDDLTEGLYLVSIRDKINPPRYIFTPFVVPYPYNGNYFVTAVPKGVLPVHIIEPEPVPLTEPEPVPLSEPEPVLLPEPEPASEPAPENPYKEIPGPKVPKTDLPHTGQLRWPIPCLALSGVFLIISGCALRQKRRRA